MLSFLREQSVEDSSGQRSAADRGERAGVDEGKAQQEEYLTVNSRGRKIHKGTIVFIVVFCIGLLCLLFMIKQSSPETAAAGEGGAAADETQIEIAIARIVNARSDMFAKTEKIVDNFYEFSKVRQVKVSGLKKNPFKTERLLGNLERSYNNEEFATDSEMFRQQRLRERIDSLDLLSIMQSGQGDMRRCCMINGKILYEGDSIEGFKVCRINRGSVELESEGVEIVLKLLAGEY